ncbi:DUF6456 domain-containing protein [Sphingopyxis solisilvae]|uniref:DUF6456 domain-containing protein n=1 Tax=Sphingopyxis solisilvae TaxID=1886788 RepID=UPI001E4946F5|nr:DUF6456 domain-containing protein [Sphingopyxis solisilvae]
MIARQLTDCLHPDDRIDPGKSGPQAMRRVTMNVAESPVQWLASRGLLTEAQCRAGERLRADYERAGLAARVTMRWDAAPPAKVRGGARAADASLARIDAQRRFHGALEAVGPGLADICWRVICAGEGIAGAEKGLGWPARSGKLVLGLALDRLARFYGVG